MNKKIIAISVLIAILFVGAIAGTIFYYNGVVNESSSEIALRNSQIANLINENINLHNEIDNLTNEINNLTNEIANLNSQISNLSGQLTNLTSANLVTSLGATEIPSNSSYNSLHPTSYNHLYISGSVTNTGDGTAFNAGLEVVAYAADGTLEINMTVPLDGNEAAFGTDAGTNAFVSTLEEPASLQLVSLAGEETATISINIFHEGTVTNWIITPVWTNSP